ncbi:MAG TPA: MmgE/PrpD family protein [Mycobacterium sp.]|jgi:2-methylcitrate dehydratase PrpD|nr:MmgE/PrpD family protein [Mycobacterium sp.]
MKPHDFDQHPRPTLAEFVAATPPELIPDEVIARLRRLMLDWIGITAFAGHHAENAGPVRAAVDKLDAGAGGTVVGQAQTRSPLYAAFLNGTFAHSMDFDDTNIVEIGHPGAPVIAAALADAERVGVDMATFYDALALGYEVACRVGAALGPSAYDRGFHITALAGIFGAVAVSARLRGLDAETTGSAFGLALSKAAGSMQYLANGAWNKRLHPGFAAHDGLLCVQLAQAGVIGAAEPLEGRYGLLHSYTDAAQPEQLTQELASTWILLQTGIKPYPSCRWTHGAIDAALALRTNIRAEQRPHAQIRVWLSPTAYPIVGEPEPRKIKPTNTVDAQFSVYFQVAAAWLDGHIDWSTYQRLTDPDIAEIAAHIDVDQDANLPKNGSTLIIDAGGEQIGTTIDLPLGEPGNWISDDRLRDKFERHAGPIYGIPQSRGIATSVLDAPLGMSVRDLAARLRLPARRRSVAGSCPPRADAWRTTHG